MTRCGAAAVALIVGAALAPSAGAGVTPELEDALRVASPIERIPVIATLKNQAEPAPGDSPAQILRALRREARLTQPGLLARMGLSEARGYWTVNAISASALPREVRRMAADPVVAGVDIDPPVALPVDRSPANHLFQAWPGSWGLDAVRAPQAWREVGVTGSSVRIGDIDTGVDPTHPALVGKVAGWHDVVGGRAAPYDDHGHGTHTAGTLVGGDAARAPLGVAPGAKLLVVKAIPGDGDGMGSDIIAAAEWLADPDGDPATADFPEVISNSWGELADANDPWFRPVLRRWRALGIVAVFAAGNSGPHKGSVGSPSGYPEALAVGAVDPNGLVANFSSRGPVAWENRDGLGQVAGSIVKPDLAAPGVGVGSSIPGGGYQAYSGTSQAAPHVAGVAALVRSANPSLTAPEVEGILRVTAADLGPPGRDNATGAGLVDALAATRQAVRRPRTTPRGAPRLRPVRRHGARLTVTQLRIDRRIALTAAARVARLEGRLGLTPAGPNPVTAAALAPIRRLSAEQMRLTQRIAQSALRRAATVQSHIAHSAAVVRIATTAGPTRRVGLTVRQHLINQRIAQAALRRVRQAEVTAEVAGVLPPD